MMSLFYPSKNNRRYSMSDVEEAAKDFIKKHPDINRKCLKGEVHTPIKANCPHIPIKDTIKEDKVYELQLRRQWE